MKKIIGLIALVGLLVAVWLGASFYSARTTANYISSLPELYKQNNYMHIKTVEHQQSAFSSVGKFEIRYPNLFPAADGVSGAIGLIIDYKINNLLLPSSAGRIEWKLTGDEAIDAELKKLMGQGAAVHGKGIIHYNGERQSSIELSELLFKDSTNSFQLTPLKGMATWDNQKLNLQLNADHLNIRADKHVTDWRGISIGVNLSDRIQGLGTYSFNISQGKSDISTFEDMKLKKTISLANDRFNIAIAQTIKAFVFEKIKLSDMSQEFVLRDLDKDSITALQTSLRDAKDVNQLTPVERSQIAKSLRGLLDKGFSVGFPSISAKLEDGTIQGNVNIEILKSEGSADAPFVSAQRLRALGELSVNGKAGLDDTQRSTALMLGLATATPEGLKASFEFAKGVLTVNGKSHQVNQYLGGADSMINSALNP